MPDQPKKFYLTTPIYYVNARPHIGHAYTTIAADVLARRHRLLGDDVFFLTGTDEHGQKIERSAAAAGIPPQQFADEVAASFSALWQRMGITNDKFIRTTSPEHKRGAQKLFRKLQETGAIYLDTYTGAYCVSDETFVDLPAGTPCPDCGRPLEIVTEENYFFRLSQYQAKLIELIESGTLAVEPEARRNEVLSFVRGGLKDLSISRTSFQWGIPVPTPGTATQSPRAPFMERSDMSGKEPGSPSQDHVIYVWLDALANYITAIGYGSDAPEDIATFEKYWPADLHLVGKEIIRFHCVYWPAFLLAAGLPLPKKIQAHGWLLFEESKMSKSRGNIVRTETILDAFGDHYRASIVAQNKKLAAEAAKAATDAAEQENNAVIPSEPQRAASDGVQQKNNAVIPSEPQRAASDSFQQKNNAVILSEPQRAARDSVQQKNSIVILSEPQRGASDGVQQKNSIVILSEPQSGESKDLRVADTATAVQPVLTEQPSFIPEPTKSDCDLFAADVLRYFLLREIPFGQDGSFSFDALITRYNADLANGYGNLVSRTLSMINAYFDGAVPAAHGPRSSQGQDESSIAIRTKMLEVSEAFEKEGDSFKFSSYLTQVASLIADVDRFLSTEAPWKLAKLNDDESRQRLQRVLYIAASSIHFTTAILYPVMPHTTAKVWAQLGLGDIEAAARSGELKDLKWGGLKPGTKLGPLAPIFPRAPKELAQVMSDIEAQSNPAKPAAESAAVPATPPPGTAPLSEKSLESVSSVLSSSSEPAPTSPLISIDDFAKVDLRVARVLVAERIPKADKLLRLEVDLGPTFNPPTRQILAGIAQYYDPEKLIGRKVVIVANLAPRKMRGLESQGMVVAASIEPDGAPALASFLEDIEIGARLK